MSIDAYAGLSKNEITKTRLTANGNRYSLDHKRQLLVPMRYKGIGISGSNSQGWEVNSKYYFEKLKESCPEAFNLKNSRLIEQGKAPYINAQFVKHFPEYKSFVKQGKVILHHHHIGRNGMAVALPKDVHTGKDNIHVVENGLGVTSKAKQFSEKCEQWCQKHPSYIGKTSDELKQIISQKRKLNHNAFTTSSKNLPKSIEGKKGNAITVKSASQSHPEHNKDQTSNAMRDKTKSPHQSGRQHNPLTQTRTR